MARYQFTKIIATIGPSSSSSKVLTNLIEAGVQTFRLNFSHGDYNEQLAKVQTIRRVCKKLFIKPTLMLDTKGPEIRTHDFASNTIIKSNSTLRVYCWKEIKGGNKEFSVTYRNLSRDIKIGQRILIDDGNLTLVCQKVLDGVVICKALNELKMLSHRSVNIPDSELKIKFLSDGDKADIEFACKHNFDWIALSFVGTKSNIMDVRKLLKEHGKENIKICAKIESRQGIENLSAIIKAADAVMVARGDLAIEVPYYTVPRHQKDIIAIAKQFNKPVIVATQMLNNLIHNLMPTRAETQDVYNAVFQGTDSCMLSGETANGEYPVEAAKIMGRIIKEANIDYFRGQSVNFQNLNIILAKHNLPSVADDTGLILIHNTDIPEKDLLKIAKFHLPLQIVLIYKSIKHKNNKFFYGFTYNYFSAIVTDDFSPQTIKKLIANFLDGIENQKYQILISKPAKDLK